MKSWDFARIPLFIRRKSYIQHTSTYSPHSHCSRVGTFGSSTAPWSSVREFIFRKTQRASSQEVSVRRILLRASCHCKLQGTKRNPIETPKSPALISLRSGSTNILIRASAIFIASNSHMSWLQSLWSHFHTIILWQDKPLTSQVLLSKKQNGKTEITQECLRHIFYRFNFFSTIQVSTLKQIPWAIHELGRLWFMAKSQIMDRNVIQIAPSPGYHGSQPFGEHPCQTWLALLAESHHPVVFPGAKWTGHRWAKS